MISTLKSLILTTFVKKIVSRRAPYREAVTLARRWAASGGPLRGG